MKNVAVVSISANNLCLPFECTEIHKKNFLFSSINTMSSISNSRLSSLGIFKHKLLKFLHFLSCNYLFYIRDCPVLISHTHLRLVTSLRKNFLVPSFTCLCSLQCDESIEEEKHYFHYCPSVAALFERLLTSMLHNNITWK